MGNCKVLYSFPTRRSSDLVAKARPLICREEEGSIFDDWAADGASILIAFQRVPRNAISIDRKSTRLNSSHVAISYAVFCLKKKKKINNRLMSLQYRA